MYRQALFLLFYNHHHHHHHHQPLSQILPFYTPWQTFYRLLKASWTSFHLHISINCLNQHHRFTFPRCNLRKLEKFRIVKMGKLGNVLERGPGCYELRPWLAVFPTMVGWHKLTIMFLNTYFRKSDLKTIELKINVNCLTSSAWKKNSLQLCTYVEKAHSYLFLYF